MGYNLFFTFDDERELRLEVFRGKRLVC